MRGVGRRAGACAADGADRTAHLEAVEVLVRRRQLVELDADAVGLVGHGEHVTVADDVAEVLVAGELVAHAIGLRGEAAADRQRLRGDPCPQDHAVRRRIARGDAQGEGVAREGRLGGRPRGQRSGECDAGRERAARAQERAACDALIPVAGDRHGWPPCGGDEARSSLRPRPRARYPPSVGNHSTPAKRLRRLSGRLRVGPGIRWTASASAATRSSGRSPAAGWRSCTSPANRRSTASSR